jgi:hypothetical protein
MVVVLVWASLGGATTITRLPTTPPFNWGTTFGLVGGFVQEYLQLNGAGGGTVIPFTVDVFDNDPDPAEKDPLVNGKEKIGTLNFQFMLWRGSSAEGGAIDRVGASIFGGFNLTDLDDAGTRFSFLQTITGFATIPDGVDGGGFRGKFNDDIATGTYNSMPGWNYQGTQYDYLDNPFTSISTGPRTISFETALDCYTDNKQVHILADFTWGFTSDGAGGVTGVSPTAQNAASNSLFNNYFANTVPPGPSPAGNTPSLMQNIGVGGCHDFAASVVQPPLPIPKDIPEPPTLLLFGIGLAVYFLRKEKGSLF